jgi:GNAT superfamily N-acetyltransferase
LPIPKIEVDFFRQHYQIIMIIVKHDTATALTIMKEAAEWLISKEMPLWDPCEFSDGTILKTVDKTDFYCAFFHDVPAAAMIFQWSDPAFWPHAHGDSGFIHKLCVKRAFAGKGIPKEMIAWAKNQVLGKNRFFLRLDCAADRSKLCGLYEDMGFKKVDRRMVGPYDIAFYEMKV